MNTNSKTFIFTFPVIVFLIAASCQTPDPPSSGSAPAYRFTVDSPTDTFLHYAATGTVAEKMFAYYNLSFDYVAINKNLSIQYSKELIRLAQQEKNKYWEATAYSHIGSAFGFESQFDSAIFYYKTAAPIFQNIKNDYKAILCKKGIAQFLEKSFRFDEALELFQECLDFLSSSEKYIEDRTRILQNIGTLYSEMGLYDLSIDYYEQALQIFHSMEQNDRVLRDIGCCYQGIGSNFFKKKEYHQSIEYYEKSLEYLRQINDQYYSGYSFGGLAECYLALGKDEETRKIIDEFDEFSKPLHNQFFLFSVSYTKAKYYYQQRQYKQSLEYAKEAQSFLSESDKRSLAGLYETLALAAAHAGTPNETAGYIEKLIRLKKEAFDEERNKSVAEMEAKYETEKKELHISALEEEKRLMKWLGITAGAMLLLALASTLFLWRLTVRKRQLAESRISQLEQEKQLIAAQSLLDGETQERTRLARDLHDGLGSILAGAKLNLQEMKKGVQMDAATVQRYDAALGLLDESVGEMRRIAHHLMPESLTNSGLMKATADFCKNIPIANFNYYGAEMRFDPKTEVMLYRIMHELVTNALKHSGASQILVQIVSEPGRIALTVQDNGCGFDPSAQSKGMGLSNIRTRVAACNGTLMVDSHPGTGTEVNVEIQL